MEPLSYMAVTGSLENGSAYQNMSRAFSRLAERS